ncbi:MAG: HIT domain-containing protein [Puniceicoccales bacterium]|jgi:ATP adenylyltransferase|nr:HIT domain-containing protein [Puniceicoccales bacterium]
MRYLHAHWRIGYVRTPRERRKAPFEAALDAVSPREHLLLYRDASAFILMNRYPYNAGHLLVLPVRRVGDLAELDDGEAAGLMAGIRRAQRTLVRAMAPDGFNIGFNVGGAAGAGLPDHLHCHVVPRWNGDTNFMPVVGATKVLPQALEDLYDTLLPHVP